MDFFQCQEQLPPLCDIQKLYSDETGCKDRKGLKAAMEELSIAPDESRSFHNALHDAYYTALVFAKLLSRCCDATRQALVEKTAAVLAERQETLAKSQSALDKVRARRERLIASKDKPAKAHRARKSEQDQQYQELLSALKEKGTSMEELLASLKK